MTLRDLSEEEFTELLKKAIIECNVKKCPIPVSLTSEVSHILGVVVDIGEGDARQGVETIRTHHKVMKELITARTRINQVISTSVIVGVVSILLALVGFAVKEPQPNN